MDDRVTSIFGRAKQLIRSVLSEKPEEVPRHPVVGFLHFWVFVGRSFVKNRCPVRATALAYTTLLALVPLLAVSLGVTTSLLKSDREQTRQLIEQLIGQLAPQLEQVPGSEQEAEAARERTVDYIQNFIANIHSGALGVTGTVALVFIAIGLLSTIEASFNDIWGVRRGRSWPSRVIHYWSAITLGPLIVIVALGMAVSAQLLVAPDPPQVTPYRVESESGEAALRADDRGEVEGGVVEGARSGTLRALRTLAKGPLGRLVLNLAPFVILSIFFSLLYQLMPNTKVNWKAAAVGGMVGALLWLLNSKFNVIFASRVVSASKIYGPLGVFPVFLIGIYVSWIIVLFGAQVAYAVQHRHAYLQEKRNERVTQRGREFASLGLMLSVADRFHRGAMPASVEELATELGVPSRLVTRLVEPLCRQNLLVEVNAPDPGYVPKRPLDRINLDDILEALRSDGGPELPAWSGGGHDALRESYLAVKRAEREAAGSLTLLQLLEAKRKNPMREDPLDRGGAGKV